LRQRSPWPAWTVYGQRRPDPGEIIRIGADISITVLDIDPGRIRLGIEAPRAVLICRGSGARIGL
jgi:hypothetical protein